MADTGDGLDLIRYEADDEDNDKSYLPGSVDELDDPYKYTDPERSLFKLFKGLFGL
jgi:hypothetical protein